MSQNRYEVLDKIAEGGLGAVYKAYDRNLRREVALKRVRADSPEQAERQAEQLFEEARTLSILQHPHIVTIFDVGRDDEGAFIVMELLKGETVEDIIERGALAEHDFRELVTQSLEGMIAAHTTGLIHLDIKPQNFMVIWLPSGKFQIKILDFGLSKIAHSPLVQETDEEGAILGSIFFMAPEQFERSPVDVRTDLYSLGCIYYFALTQNYPFQGETAPEVMASHLYHSYIPLAQLRPDLPSFICQWVEWLMNRDPSTRPESAAYAFEIFKSGRFPSRQVLPAPDYVLTEADLDRPATASQPLRPGGLRPQRPGSTQRLGGRPVPKPVAKAINIAAARAPEHLKARKPLPKWLTVWVPLSLVVLVLGWFGVQYFLQSQRVSRFNTLVALSPPKGSPDDVRLLLRFLEDPGTSEAAGKVLGQIEGPDFYNKLIVEGVSKAKSPVAVQHVASAVSTRGLKEAVPRLLRQLNTATVPATRQALWSALGSLATYTDVSEMLSQMKANDIDDLRYAEAAIVSAARTDADADARSRETLQQYRANSGSEDQRAALLRILGKLGGPASLPDLTAALKSTSLKLRTAAASAVGDWPTAEPVLPLEELIRDEKDSYIKTNALNSLGALAPLSGDIPQDEIAQALIEAYQTTRENRERTAALSSLAQVISPASLAFFKELASKEPRLRATVADPAIKSIQAAMDRAITVGEGATILEVSKAELTPGPLAVVDGVIINWFGVTDRVNWLIKIEQPGRYEVKLSQSSTGSGTGIYAVTFGSERFQKNVEKTSSQIDFKEVVAGSAAFSKPGYYRLWIRPQQVPSSEILMRLKQGSLTKG